MFLSVKTNYYIYNTNLTTFLRVGVPRMFLCVVLSAAEFIQSTYTNTLVKKYSNLSY